MAYAVKTTGAEFPTVFDAATYRSHHDTVHFYDEDGDEVGMTVLENTEWVSEVEDDKLAEIESMVEDVFGGNEPYSFEDLDQLF